MIYVNAFCKKLIILWSQKPSQALAVLLPLGSFMEKVGHILILYD